MSDPFKVRVTGPLSSQAHNFATEMIRAGYSQCTARDQVYVLAQLSRWLNDERLAAAELTPAAVNRFLLARRAAGYRRWRTLRSLQPMLAFLRAAQVVPAAGHAGPDSAAGALLLAYRRYLLVERRLAETSVTARVAVARRFLSTLGSGGELQLPRLAAADVTGFVLGESARYRSGSMKALTVALRCLLRFLFLTAVVDRDLSAAVPTVAHRSMTALPKGIDAETVAALLAGCDRSTPVGIRDHGDLDTAGAAWAPCWRGGRITSRGRGLAGR